MELTEDQVNLIRIWMHVTILVKHCADSIQAAKENKHMMMKDLYIRKEKIFGRLFTRMQMDATIELRKKGIHTWLENEGAEDDKGIVYVNVSNRGRKSRHGVKRRIIDEEIDKLLKELEKYMDNEQDWPDYDKIAKRNPWPKVKVWEREG